MQKKQEEKKILYGNPRKKFQSDSLILISEEIILVIPNFFHDFCK